MKNKALEVWYCDDTGFLADPRPRSLALSAFVINHVDTDVFQAFLDQLAGETEGRNVVLVLDNASWHKAYAMRLYHSSNHRMKSNQYVLYNAVLLGKTILIILIEILWPIELFLSGAKLSRG